MSGFLRCARRCIVHFQGMLGLQRLLYLQLAVVQAGHWNLLHFHLPELPDEPSLLWSCCSASSTGQNRAAAAGRRGTKHTFYQFYQHRILWIRARSVRTRRCCGYSQRARRTPPETHGYPPTFIACEIQNKSQWARTTGRSRSCPSVEVGGGHSLARTRRRKTKSAATRRMEEELNVPGREVVVFLTPREAAPAGSTAAKKKKRIKPGRG